MIILTILFTSHHMFTVHLKFQIDLLVSTLIIQIIEIYAVPLLQLLQFFVRRAAIRQFNNLRQNTCMMMQ